MKRLIQRFVKWLYAEGIEIQVERAIEAQFNERFPEEFRAKTSYTPQLIPQDVLAAVLRHLPNPAVIHRFTCATLQRLSRTGFQNFEVK